MKLKVNQYTGSVYYGKLCVAKIQNRDEGFKIWSLDSLSSHLYSPYPFKTRKDALAHIEGVCKEIFREVLKNEIN